MKPATDREERAFFVFDLVLVTLTSAVLIGVLFKMPQADAILAALSFLGLIPVLWSAIKSLIKRRLSVDLLASIALGFSLIDKEWVSAALITLMLAFARIFEYVTSARVKRVIQSLMKYHVERVRLQVGETVKDVHISEVRPGDMVVVDSGDRMPVDGVVMSGAADVDESSLTGESELVPKKPGDKVFTATMNESGSLVVKTERVGADTTLAKIIKLVEEAGRDKSQAERMADRFTQWYIFISLLASGFMWWYGLSPGEILAVLLVVCADDVAVAVPLAFTAGIARAAKDGVIVKGSAALEQLSKMKFLLTDKTGTLTRGKPKVVDIRAYKPFSAHKVLELAMMGASESKHAVSRAIIDYGKGKGMTIHAPQELEEAPGQGVRFRHGIDRMLLGRPSFMAHDGTAVPEEAKRDLTLEKDAGRGVAVLSVNGKTAGLISYGDELRPRVKEIIAETRKYGVREWHILTGDNEHAAAAVAGELGLRHFHANMTPESKVEFVHKFEREKEPEVVGYIGDGVNDAASMALADVSIAMGGIGADAAIEAADIAIMKDRLDRLPQVMRTAQVIRHIMWQCFAIWFMTNAVGLLWVIVGIPGLGVLGPSGAAAFNFLTDFLPIGNALRAGRK
ncbi:MAG: cation-translocating P-type ATPase [Minisyncoccia bacterium]|jgi:heavy metal translocating P-type ATPase